MATITGVFYNVKCDCCGRMASEEIWEVDEGVIRGEIMPEENWKTLGGKDYCHDCWTYDDDDNIVTKDGRVWCEDTEEEMYNIELNVDDKSKDAISDVDLHKLAEEECKIIPTMVAPHWCWIDGFKAGFRKKETLVGEKIRKEKL